MLRQSSIAKYLGCAQFCAVTNHTAFNSFVVKDFSFKGPTLGQTLKGLLHIIAEMVLEFLACIENCFLKHSNSCTNLNCHQGLSERTAL